MTARIAPPEGPVRYNTALDHAMHAFEMSVMALTSVDPVTVEVVRLRCARVHDCRRCQSVRYEEALREGFDEEIGARIDDYEHSDLAPHHKAALRLVDAFIQSPGLVDQGLRADLHSHFSPVAIAELCLLIVKFSVQKTLVALRIDEPLADGTTVLSATAPAPTSSAPA